MFKASILSVLKGIKWETIQNPQFDSMKYRVTLRYWGLKGNEWIKDKMFIEGLDLSNEFILDAGPDVVTSLLETGKKEMLLSLFKILYENPEHYEAFSSDIPFDLSDIPIYTSRIMMV